MNDRRHTHPDEVQHYRPALWRTHGDMIPDAAHIEQGDEYEPEAQ
jgi:hypothetical protein